MTDATLVVVNQNSIDVDKPERFYLEKDLEIVIRAIDDGSTPDKNYYWIKTNPANATLHKITLKGGVRPHVGDIEQATAEADNQDIGTADVRA